MIEIIQGEKNDGSANEDGSCVGGAESSDSGIRGVWGSRLLGVSESWDVTRLREGEMPRMTPRVLP